VEHAAEVFGEGVHFCSDTTKGADTLCTVLVHFGCALPLELTAPPVRDAMSLGTILLIILVIALVGGFSGLGGGLFYGTGYYGGGGLGLVLVIVLVLVLLGRI
jgi:hypothetical protein